MDQHTISSMMFCSSIKCLPRQPTAELKERRVDACQELLKCFEVEGDGFLGRIFKGNETWVHYHQAETKTASGEWRHTFSPKSKKFREPSAGKVMLTVFWDTRGVILEYYMPKGNTVTSKTYADLLKNHHQERIQLYLQHLVFVTPLLLSAAIVEELGLVSVCCGWRTTPTAHSNRLCISW
jgi:hypothetical protein